MWTTVRPALCNNSSVRRIVRPYDLEGGKVEWLYFQVTTQPGPDTGNKELSL